jgi:RNA polymerase sigma-B factor
VVSQLNDDARTKGQGAWERPAEEEDRSEVTARLLRRVQESTDSRERKRLQDEVVVLNMCVADAITSRYLGRGIPTEDLRQAAYIGLCKAAQGFNAAYELDFLAYAVPTISGEIKRYFRDHGWAVRPPRRIQELQGQVSSVVSQLSQDLGRSPRPSEVAQYLEVPVEEVIEALSADGCFTPTSLDTPIGDSGDSSLGELLPANASDMSAAEARIMLAPAVRSLGERDQRILYLRFFKQWTQEQIANDIGVTQMQVSRLLSRILKELRGKLE